MDVRVSYLLVRISLSSSCLSKNRVLELYIFNKAFVIRAFVSFQLYVLFYTAGEERIFYNNFVVHNFVYIGRFSSPPAI